MIATGPHHLTPSLTKRCIKILTEGDDDPDGYGVWLGGAMFHALLQTIPTLKTLKLENWIFEEETWKGLRRPHATQPDPQDQPILGLEGLYLSFPRIRSTHLSDVQEMVTSHPLRRVIIGILDKNSVPNHTHGKPLQERSDLMEWLRDNVSDFRVVDSEEHIPEFDSAKWKIW
ncbi:hypothetical protein B0J17DRAFT_710089 [Rhizoctonia solani]|nr:hypothetical protein B0J17DRAFT_710089 [Rhizoctonia solani]